MTGCANEQTASIRIRVTPAVLNELGMFVDPDLWRWTNRERLAKLKTSMLRATCTGKSNKSCKVTMFYACNGCGFGPLAAGANGEAGDLKFCGKCRDRSYCSRECQVRDWSRHKPECARMCTRGKRKR